MLSTNASRLREGRAQDEGNHMQGMREWLAVVLATIGTGVVVGAAVALLAELLADPPTVLVGVLAGVATGLATLFVAGAVVSLRSP